MELSSLVCILFCLAPLLVFLKLVFSSQKSNPISKLPLPPGKTGWPMVGETFELGKLGRNGTSDKFFKERMDKHSERVFRTSLLGVETAVFCGVSGNKFLFTNENKLVALSWPTTSLKLFPHSGPTLADMNESSLKLRRMILAFFKTETLVNLVGTIDVLAKRHLEKSWDSQKEVRAVTLAKQFAFTVACRLFLNTDNPNHVQDLAKHFDEAGVGIYSFPWNFPGTPFNRSIKASNSIRSKLVEIIRERKNDPSTGCDDEDFLLRLLTAKDENGILMTELQVADQILAALFSSRDSTASAISLIMKFLAQYPHIYDQVDKERRSIAEAKLPGELLNWQDLKQMKYAWNVASEVFRVVPPNKGNFRVALTDLNYYNFFIPKGFKLYWSPYTTHKDARYFPEPEKFDPSRFEKSDPFPYAYVPFGGGARICPGKEIARVVILIFVYNVVGKFRWERLIPDEKLEVALAPVPDKGLPIRLYPN